MNYYTIQDSTVSYYVMQWITMTYCTEQFTTVCNGHWNKRRDHLNFRGVKNGLWSWTGSRGPQGPRDLPKLQRPFWTPPNIIPTSCILLYFWKLKSSEDCLVKQTLLHPLMYTITYTTVQYITGTYYTVNRVLLATL